MKLFEKFETKTKDDGIIVTKFRPTQPVYIDSINLDTGRIEEKEVTEYSKHENLVMYKVHSLEELFKDFWVSEDHSLIVYDVDDGKFKKETPTSFPNDDLYFVQKVDNDCRLIPSSSVNITLDPEKTIAYDFTVKDNYTFCTDDGFFVQDTMTLYTPITKEAIAEAKDKMLSSQSPKGMDSVSDEFSKDTVIGLYCLTKNSNSKDEPLVITDESEIDKLDDSMIIKIGSLVTTVGRVIFNRALPDKYPFINAPINKSKINSLVREIYKKYPKDVYVEFCNKMVQLGSKYYTIHAPSFTMDDLKIPKEIYALKDELGKAKDPDEAFKIIQKMEKMLQEFLVKSGSNFGVFGEAGGLKGGSYNQVRQILISKGLIQDSDGNPMAPITSSYADGLSSIEYFYSGIGSRSGIIDRVINTADTGYLSRQLVSVLQRVEADPGITDCGTKRFVNMNVSSDFSNKLTGRFIVDERGRPIPVPKDFKEGYIKLRSPLYCVSDRICYHCYGELLHRNRTHYVGVLAGHVLGEPLTQTIMRTFHSGGSVSMKQINIVNEILKSSNLEQSKVIKDLLMQKDSAIVPLKDGILILDDSVYLDPNEDIVIQDKTVVLKYGYFNLDFGGQIIEITIDHSLIIPLDDKTIDVSNPHSVKIGFKANTLLFAVPPQADAFSNQVKVVKAILSGKQPWRSPDHFLMKLYDFYKGIAGGVDMIHFEILASNLLRDKGNPSYPARLNKNYNATIVGLKSIPALESWLQSLNFENINASITRGLLYDRPEKETILERITSGNL